MVTFGTKECHLKWSINSIANMRDTKQKILAHGFHLLLPILFMFSS
jgi:hypothetical protein